MWKLKKKKIRGSLLFSNFFREYLFSRLASFQIFGVYLFSRMEEKSQKPRKLIPAKVNPIKVMLETGIRG